MPGTGTDLTCAEMLRLKLSEAVQIAKGAEMENERLTRERDEARADVAHFRQLYLDAINRQASCCRSITRNAQVAARRIHEIRVRLLHAEAERDEARADAERLRALLPPEELLERARRLHKDMEAARREDKALIPPLHWVCYLRALLAHFDATAEAAPGTAEWAQPLIEVRAWLDERGRRSGGCDTLVSGQGTEEGALRALVAQVAQKEADGRE
jgi:phage tail protein X